MLVRTTRVGMELPVWTPLTRTRVDVLRDIQEATVTKVWLY